MHLRRPVQGKGTRAHTGLGALQHAKVPAINFAEGRPIAIRCREARELLKSPHVQSLQYRTNQDAIRRLFLPYQVDRTGNLPSMPAVFPDQEAPVVRNAAGHRELIRMRWGMPPPPKFGGCQ